MNHESAFLMTTVSSVAEVDPPYTHAMLAGGFGGSIGDLLMHSVDTVKTRQQVAPHVAKYATLPSAYRTIYRQEGLRGLYGGITPAIMGSVPGTVMFFGTYEYSKRNLIEAGMPDTLAHLSAGFLGDLVASTIYVPSEVLKTRLQMQGRYNNPHFSSGYNYRGTLHAIETICRLEGRGALFHGYKATILRDLPFSALQFAFYERFKKAAHDHVGSRDIGMPLETLTGAMAGGLAGMITTPLDVVKTRIQTQVRSPAREIESRIPRSGSAAPSSSKSQHSRHFSSSCVHMISTSSPSTTPTLPSSVKLHTSSVAEGLKIIYKSEGFAGLFRGVAPRVAWTAAQSSFMFVLYENGLKMLAKWWPDAI
ncbi:mitochondrial carrier [Saitoella complicata NRRL Y-17804]|uniref:mitochondrial carrier n=1 Tax=Saitoella complicata (strain BCRC 22490 / CBS 7301 / JCM 7358 / NBRC 10748 / NRRL Y-17804) TaxID=698492 RepID=UPI00086688C2|nr:mitochondrial carrier [Saitoella complicata NRRL Y-17804]ODQ54462.1 mitochondrial carrier [Saitoella complicata NRRL Y-17804]